MAAQTRISAPRLSRSRATKTRQNYLQAVILVIHSSSAPGALVRLKITEVRGIEFSTARPVAVHERDRSDCQTRPAFTPLVELRAVQPAVADRPCALDWCWAGLAGPNRPRPARCGCGNQKSWR